MLVLTRKAHQRVIIGGNIELEVLGISGRSVKLGFTVPPEIPVHREELWQRMAAADQKAIATGEASS